MLLITNDASVVFRMTDIENRDPSVEKNDNLEFEELSACYFKNYVPQSLYGMSIAIVTSIDNVDVWKAISLSFSSPALHSVFPLTGDLAMESMGVHPFNVEQ